MYSDYKTMFDILSGILMFSNKEYENVDLYIIVHLMSKCIILPNMKIFFFIFQMFKHTIVFHPISVLF